MLHSIITYNFTWLLFFIIIVLHPVLKAYRYIYCVMYKNEPRAQSNLALVKWVSEWVSEWLLFNANSAIFQLYHGENKLIFNEMMMRSALY
jgi:hypothetical protein